MIVKISTLPRVLQKDSAEERRGPVQKRAGGGQNREPSALPGAKFKSNAVQDLARKLWLTSPPRLVKPLQLCAPATTSRSVLADTPRPEELPDRSG